MDASAVAQAALALSINNSRDAAMNELLQERERLAMAAEDMRTFVASRHFTRDLISQPQRGSVSPAHVPWTWKRAYNQLLSQWQNRHDAIHEALRDVRMGEPESAERLLRHEVGEFSDNEENDEHLREYPA